MKFKYLRILFLIFVSPFILLSCTLLRNDDIPDIEISRIAFQYPDYYASDITLYYEGDEIPENYTHLAMIKVIGKKNTSEDILWDYLKHHALKIHANGLISMNTNSVAQSELNRKGDQYYDGYSILEISAIAIRAEIPHFYWNSSYYSEYEHRIEDYLKKVRKENKKYLIIPVLSGLALATLVILNAEH